jgi:beta-lactamase regulating signal transducer with metallopeptidase domain
MNFFEGLNWNTIGVDAGIVIGIVALCEALKRTVFKKVGKTKNYMVLFTVLLSCIAAFAKTSPFHVQPFLGNILRYAGISTLVYILSKPLLKKVGL